ncbi:hypothetical protein PS943_05924 [Pseudomonas fluorescens]|uniref:Uncharacterized protein n=1 Tax=Pseudomonas fluorescens TaxID=294 RepID=A0A5E7WUP8_PSEFL|nr:hypothetical protein [Pseudomonas fluorescens]VVQ38480.1 hypothetical protein PS943_05924 [Pseudomonas fluorescens]
MFNLDKLRKEIHEKIDLRNELALATVRGQLHWLLRTDKKHQNSAIAWALKAQEGTLEKFRDVYSTSKLESDTELVALARNLFENIVWLKLFNKNTDYGLVFYHQLLGEQLKSQEQVIEKARGEIRLFNELAEEDKVDFGPYTLLMEQDSASEEELQQVRDYLSNQSAIVDTKARNAFSIYGESAKVNGYSFQAHLIETKVIPHHEQRISVLHKHLEELKESHSEVALSRLKALGINARWNWCDKAKSVGMADHYYFLYAFTSRSLHCTAMNIITPKALDDKERYLLLDYISITCENCYNEIEQFDYPGKVNLAYVEL